MANTSLLEKEGPITLEDLKANFRANDFSAYSSGFGDKEESTERNDRYNMIRKHFKGVWYDQLKTMSTKPLPRFSKVSPIGCLERSESSLVAGTVVNIMESERQTEMLLDIGLQVMQEPLEKELEQLANAKGITPEELTEDMLSGYLYSAGVPDPELIIRPSGEMRTSNFLLWQSAYSEYVFLNVLWPDFDEKELDKAIESFYSRKRRYGGV